MHFSRLAYTFLGYAQMLAFYLLVKGYYFFYYIHSEGVVIDYLKNGYLNYRKPLVKTSFQNQDLLFYNNETTIYGRKEVVSVLISPDGTEAMILDFWGFFFNYTYIIAFMVWPVFVFSVVKHFQYVEIKLKYWKRIPYVHLDLPFWVQGTKK